MSNIIMAILAIPIYIAQVQVSSGDEYTVSKWNAGDPVVVQTTQRAGCRVLTSESSAPGISVLINDAMLSPGVSLIWTSSDGNSHAMAEFDAGLGIMYFAAFEAGMVPSDCEIKLDQGVSEPKALAGHINAASAA